MVDFNLSDHQRHWQQVAREYTRQSLAPVVRDYDARPDPLDRMPWPAIKDANQVGLRTLSVPEEWGGPGWDWLTLCVAAEEVAVADIGTATTLEINWMYFPLLYALMTPAQREQFLRPHVDNAIGLLAPCFTEPNSGSDNSLPYDGIDGGNRTYAAHDGDGWVINGRKHFTSTGGCADLYLLMTRNDLSRPPSQSATLFVVTPDTPGFTIGRAHEKSAHRTSPQTEEVFENLRLSDEHRVGPIGGFVAASRRYRQPVGCLAAGGFVGTGRGAFELALEYARRPVEGGKPLIQQQAIAMTLAEMSMRLEAARFVAWHAASRADEGDLSDPYLGSRAKVVASEASFDVCRMAFELFGEYGVRTDCDIERYLRDACANLHDFGANQVQRIRVAVGLGYRLSEA